MATPARFLSLGGILLIASLGGIADDRPSRNEDQVPIADVFDVMGEAKILHSRSLWPGFEISKIPVAVYDGLNSYLFNSSINPEGFLPLRGKPDVLVYRGQHPLIRGNSIVRMNDVWTAAGVLSKSSRRTGEPYGIRDLAGIIIHEQFHVFQRINHPDWRPNDGLLLLYPQDTAETLFLRKIEKEAFKRAVLSRGQKETIVWAKEALQYRERRLNLLDPSFKPYERELQRTEGLSDYIEKTARGTDPLNASNITTGLAPAGVREMGYIEGRWIAMILDRLKPDWKTVLEKGEVPYLEEILKAAVGGSDSTPGFSDQEIREIRTAAEIDIENWTIAKKQQLEKFDQAPGYQIEINSASDPLRIGIFEPLEIETLADRAVFHRVIFSANNDKGGLRIMNQPCLTVFDESLRVVQSVIHGLNAPPEIDEKERAFRVKTDTVTIEFRYSKLSIDKNRYSFEL